MAKATAKKKKAARIIKGVKLTGWAKRWITYVLVDELNAALDQRGADDSERKRLLDIAQEVFKSTPLDQNALYNTSVLFGVDDLFEEAWEQALDMGFKKVSRQLPDWA